MRILYSHRTRTADGQYVHIDGLVRAFQRAGHDVIMAGPEGIGPAQDLTQRLTSPKPGASQKMRRSGSGMYELLERAYSAIGYGRLAKAIPRYAPDFIYERYNLHYHAGVSAARKYDLPLLLEVNAPYAIERSRHGRLAWKNWAEQSERQIWKAADALFPVTSVLANMIVTSTDLDPGKVHVVSNGVNDTFLKTQDPTEIRRQYGLEDKLILGFAGFVRQWHGLPRILQWLASLEGRNAVLLVVGDGPAVPDLIAQAENMGVLDRVKVTGVVQREDMPAHIAAFDIALQPAVTPYASPLKLQEYMAQSRAVVAPNQPNIRETVEDGVSALLFPPEDPEALATALNRLAASASLRQTLGTRARAELFERRRTWDHNARTIITVAHRLIEERGK